METERDGIGFKRRNLLVFEKQSVNVWIERQIGINKEGRKEGRNTVMETQCQKEEEDRVVEILPAITLSFEGPHTNGLGPSLPRAIL